MTARKRKPSRRTDATGRSIRAPKHARIYMWEAESAAYRSLCCGARALLIEIRMLSDGEGRNNGDIGLSERRAAELLNVDRKTVRGYFAQLIDRGFIRVSRRGAFTCKAQIATKWIITNESVNGQLATKDYLWWQPAAEAAQEKNAGGKIPPDGAKNSPVARRGATKTPPTGPKIPPVMPPEDPATGEKIPPLLVYHAQQADARQRGSAQAPKVPEALKALLSLKIKARGWNQRQLAEAAGVIPRSCRTSNAASAAPASASPACSTCSASPRRPGREGHRLRIQRPPRPRRRAP